MRENRRLLGWLSLTAILVIYVIILLRNAWLCDDAYITLRTVDNFVNGYGLVWNVGERVQAYSHPLWMFFLSLAYVFTNEAFLTTIIVSMLVSLAAIAIFAFRIAPSWKMAVFGVLIFLLSKFFIDYSTSGLENPLTHLLLAMFFLYFFAKRPSEKGAGLLALITSLLMLTRLDLILLVLPALVYAINKIRTWKAVRNVILGFLPLIAWELFSFCYYGFLIPNSGYAKLNTGIPRWDLIVQGAHYLEAAFRGDRLMVLIIVGAVAYTIWRKGKAGWPIATGIVLYVTYVTSIGGCFMGGRFFTGPLLVSVIALSQYERLLGSILKSLGAIAVVMLVGLNASYSPVYTGPGFGSGTNRGLGHGIDDCRHVYFQRSGLWTTDSWRTEPVDKWVDQGKRNRREGWGPVQGGGIGFLGYYSGPGVYIVDVHALSDAFLARFPAAYDVLWRIGHFVRAIPEGYMETTASGENRIADSNLAMYYDSLHYVISGPVWSRHRLMTAVRMNLGAFDGLLDAADPPLVSFHYRELPTAVPDGTPWTTKDMKAFPTRGVCVYLDSIWRPDSITVSLDGNDSYSVLFGLGRESLGHTDIHPREDGASGSVAYTLAVPDLAEKTGFDRLTITPIIGDGIYAIGHIIPRSARKAIDVTY